MVVRPRLLSRDRRAAARAASAPAAGSATASGPADLERSGLSRLQALVLARIAGAAGATRSEVLRDLEAMLDGRSAGGRIATAIGELIGRGFADEHRSRLKSTLAGGELLRALIGPVARSDDWADIRDGRLVALALGQAKPQPARLKKLQRPDGLRLAVLRHAYGLPLPRRADSAARLRAELAVVALQRAFGGGIAESGDVGVGLNARTGRLLAGQLARQPRDFGTDARLITALAGEAVGAEKGDPPALRQAVLRRWLAAGSEGAAAAIAPAAEHAVAKPPTAAVPAAVVPATAAPATAVPAATAPTTRPDLEGFARTVRELAAATAEGWPGNRKAFISHVWRALCDRHAAWGLSEIEFKAMLAEAHRTGHIVLANADIRSKSQQAELQNSAIAYKNTVWHFVRVED